MNRLVSNVSLRALFFKDSDVSNYNLEQIEIYLYDCICIFRLSEEFSSTFS